MFFFVIVVMITILAELPPKSILVPTDDTPSLHWLLFIALRSGIYIPEAITPLNASPWRVLFRPPSTWTHGEICTLVRHAWRYFCSLLLWGTIIKETISNTKPLVLCTSRIKFLFWELDLNATFYVHSSILLRPVLLIAYSHSLSHFENNMKPSRNRHCLLCFKLLNMLAQRNCVKI